MRHIDGGVAALVTADDPNASPSAVLVHRGDSNAVTTLPEPPLSRRSLTCTDLFAAWPALFVSAGSYSANQECSKLARVLWRSADGGQTWTLTTAPPVTGAIFGLSYVGQTGRGGGNNLGRAVVVTANDGGAAWTPDEGTTWFTLPDVTGFWAVAFATPKAGWLVGTDGRILKISF
jgi:photosystem II stability/assembly factor-like uncharacterized protein